MRAGWRSLVLAGTGAALAAWSATSAAAAGVVGQPSPGALGLQSPATEVKADIIAFHDGLLWVITLISLLVLALLLWVIVRYNRAANPKPKTFSHNTFVEVVWTVVPVLILVGISVFSFPLLAKEERMFGGADIDPAEVVTIKAIGNSWYWTHEYPDYDLQIVSNVLPNDEAAALGKPAKLAVDSPIYAPVGTYVRLLVTSNDVIHSWAMPSFGVKEDAIPGRVNEGWFKIEREGVFYGQCSELCGLRHAFMPIEVRGVSRAVFDAWVAEQGGTLPQASAAGSEPAAGESAG